MPPSGSRKKRAARRKKTLQNSPTNPNPNSDPFPPLPLLNNQGNGNSSDPEEEGEDETFETPKGHPDTPIAGAVRVGSFGNRSSSNLLQSDRFPVVAEGSAEKFYTPAAADVDNNGSKTSIQEVDIDSDENNGLSEMGEENHVVVVDNPEDHLVGSEVIGEEVKLDDGVPMEQTVTAEEEPVEFHEAQTGNPEISLPEPVPWRDEEPPSVDFEATPEGRAKELIPVDEALKEIRLEKLADEICTSVQNSTLVTEEVNHRSKATAENLEKSLVGVTSPEERKAREPPLSVEVKGVPAPDATAGTETSPRTEVANGPLVVRRASLWNCCGLLEVVTGSER